jgi:hypothetical protein
VLCVPLPFILAVVPFLWGLAAGTPAAIISLNHIGLLTKVGTVERLSAAAADTSQSGLYRERALKEISALLPAPDPAARKALANLRKIVKDTRPGFSGLRAAASELVLKVSPDTAVESLTEQLLKDPDSTFRCRAANQLREMGPAARDAAASLEAAIGDADAAVQEAAAQALLKIAPEEAITRLVANLKSSDGRVRQKAAALLRDIGPPAHAAIPMLEKARRDSDIQVREMAAAALQSIDPKGHPARRREVAPKPPSYDAANSTYHPRDILPPGTYRVPASRSLELSGDRLNIELERSKLNGMINELHQLGSEVESERSSYNRLVSDVNMSANQLNLEASYLDRKNQFAVDNYNYKVRNHNSLVQQLEYQKQRYNKAVDEYNAKAQEARYQQQHVNELVDEYNRKLEMYGSR